MHCYDTNNPVLPGAEGLDQQNISNKSLQNVFLAFILVWSGFSKSAKLVWLCLAPKDDRDSLNSSVLSST